MTGFGDFTGTAALRSGDFDDPRDRLALALDVDDLVAAVRVAKSVSGYFRIAKVGLELYSAAGPDVIGVMAGLGYEVFCDLKLHDIPNTVNRSARVLGEFGVSYLTIHAAGGAEMLEAGVEGLAAGSSGDATVLAVTVLTSHQPTERTAAQVAQGMELAARAGCGGVICAAPDLASTADIEPELLRVVPGIRLAGEPAHDQRRVATPADAVASGADILVIGRAVTDAADPVATARRIHSEIRG